MVPRESVSIVLDGEVIHPKPFLLSFLVTAAGTSFPVVAVVVVVLSRPEQREAEEVRRTPNRVAKIE